MKIFFPPQNELSPLRKHEEEVFQVEDEALQPVKAYQGDAGWDLKAAKRCVIHAGCTVRVPTGVRFNLPHGYVGLLQERSSMGVAGVFSVGNVIDAGYKGEVSLILHNASKSNFIAARGERVGQVLILPCAHSPVGSGLPARGDGGFGSSNKNRDPAGVYGGEETTERTP